MISKQQVALKYIQYWNLIWNVVYFHQHASQTKPFLSQSISVIITASNILHPTAIKQEIVKGTVYGNIQRWETLLKVFCAPGKY